MGIFDIFKRSNKQPGKDADESVNRDVYFLEALKTRIIALGHKVDMHPEKTALIVNGELEIATAVFDPPQTHWVLLHVKMLAIHPVYFPAGIEENITGMGDTLEKRTDVAINNYFEDFFVPIIESVSGRHNPSFNIFTPGGKEILCHSNPGRLTWNGRWVNYPEGEPTFDLLQDAIRARLTSNTFNWLRFFVFNHDGEVEGSCRFNDEHWQEGTDILTKYVASWQKSTDTRGVEQFIIFRR